MSGDKKQITIYEVDRYCEILINHPNPIQKCVDHVKGLAKPGTATDLNVNASNFQGYNAKGVHIFKTQMPISWLVYVNKILSTPIQNTTTDMHSAIIFLENVVSKNIYIISFGLVGYFLIKDLTLESFGIDLLSRLIDPQKISCKKTTAQSLIGKKQGEINVYRGLQTLENNIEDFGKIFQELLVAIDENKLNNFGIKNQAAGNQNKILQKNCLAKDSFKINSLTTPAQIKSLLDGCEWAKTQKATTINSVKILTSKQEQCDIDWLDAKLFDSLNNKYRNIGTPFEYDLCHKDFANYFSAEKAKIIGLGRSFDLTPAPIKIDDIFSSISAKKIVNNINKLFDFINKGRIITFDQSGQEITSDTIRKHIFAEEALGSHQHFLLNGTWYRLENNFLDYLNDKIKDSYKGIMLTDQNFITPWNSAQDETAFINGHPDVNCIKIHPNLSENIELCDMMHWDNNNLYLYFIKDGFGNQIRSLCSQILLSTDRINRELKTNRAYLKTVYQDIVSKNLTTISETDFLNLFDKEIKCVFAFHDKSSTATRTLQHNPELFRSNIAKYSLTSLIGEMRKFDRAKLEIHQIL